MSLSLSIQPLLTLTCYLHIWYDKRKQERTLRMEQKHTLYFPMFVDISQKNIIIIGGGNIAQRRIETLLDFAEHIQVIAPEVTDPIKEWDDLGKIHWICDQYRPELLEGAEIVLAATNDPQCNESVVRYCNENQIMVNTAHKKEACDFFFPGIVRSGNIVAGVTANGLNHKEAKKARECISRALKEFYP